MGLENICQKNSYIIASRVEKNFFSARDGLEIILKSLEDIKAEDIISIDIRKKSSLADYMIIASAHSQRHVSAIADHLLRTWKDSGCGLASVEGLAGGDWVLIDTGDIIIHLFRPEIRLFYNLEKIWQAPDFDNTKPLFFGDH
ncbi:hypothetical protein GCM10023260_09800 [Bartonella acomydis]|uniref:Ribosomal silencing factor RsfS n=2 Tax=Bartonella acomydis TaxID=686234 RepID=A0ABP9MNY9_9HYPH